MHMNLYLNNKFHKRYKAKKVATDLLPLMCNNCISQELFKERRKPEEAEERGWNHKLWTFMSAATAWSGIVRGPSRCCDSEIYCRGNGL